MKQSEALIVLGKIQLYSGRTVGDGDAAAWAEALDPAVTLQSALDAVAEHYRDTDAWIMPSHINAIAKRVRRERIGRAGTPPIPGGLTYAMERAWSRAWCDAVGDGAENAIELANAAIGYDPPPELPRNVTGVINQLEGKWTA